MSDLFAATSSAVISPCGLFRYIQQREAARMMGVDKCVLNRICKHGNPPSVENYLRIVAWMNKQTIEQARNV